MKMKTKIKGTNVATLIGDGSVRPQRLQDKTGPLLVLPPYTDRNVFPIGYAARGEGVFNIVGEINSMGGTDDERSTLARQVVLAFNSHAALLDACQAADHLVKEMDRAFDDVPAGVDAHLAITRANVRAALSSTSDPHDAPANSESEQVRQLREVCNECLDLLRNSEVRFKICDGGRGNLGEQSLYHRTINKATATLNETK